MHPANDTVARLHYLFSVSSKVAEHMGTKQPKRPHHIVEWAETLGLKQHELAEALGADKSVVSRWYAGGSPGVDYQERLATFFKTSRESLFRHPDEAWVANFLSGRKREEIDRIKMMLEAAFPAQSP